MLCPENQRDTVPAPFPGKGAQTFPATMILGASSEDDQGRQLARIFCV